MKKRIMRLLSLFLATVFVLGAVIIPAGAENLGNLLGVNTGNVDGGNLNADLSGKTELSVDRKQYKPNDEIKVIVRLKGESLLDAANALNMNVSAYALTDAGKAQIERMTAEQDAAIASFGDKILSVRYHYNALFSGFSCVMKYKDLESVEGATIVQSAMISERYEVAETEATDNALNAYTTGIYNSSGTGYTGKRIVVSILDTGLDYTHSAFQQLPNCEPVLSQDMIEKLYPLLLAPTLNEDARWEASWHSDKVPYGFDYADKDPDVYPVNDHGTHVAGIIAGKDDTITGVAVDAQLVIMKVFGNKDAGAEQEDILAGLSDSVMLGVDVINMSLGSSCGFSRAADDEGINEIYDSVREAGINLIVAASNSASSAKGSTKGDTNLTSNPDSATIGSPATYPSSMSVASVTGAKTHYLFANGEQPIYLIKAKRNNGDEIEFYDLMLNGKSVTSLEYVLVPGIGNDGNYDTVDVTGKIAVIKRGVTTFEEKVDTAKNHGAIGAIIYNNVSGTISMTIGLSDLPACSISMDSGKYFEAHPTGTLLLDETNLAGPFMSDFSSWGPNSDLELSPDVTSYGGDINSAVRGGYDILSGTSMACPNLAGSAALVRESLKEKYPELTSRELMIMVNRLLMSTASVLRNEAGNPYSPRKQGAGLADAERAIKAPAYLLVDGDDKTKLSLGDDPQKTGVYKLTFHLVNLTAYAQSYSLSVLTMTESISSDEKTVAEQAYMLSPTISYQVENGSLNGNMVTVSGYGDVTITATVTLSESDRAYLDAKFKNGMYVEGYVQLTAEDSEIDLVIPYLGFYGDWTQAPLLDVTEFEVGEEQKDPSILEDEKLKPDVFATIPMAGYYNGSGRTEDDFSYYYMGKCAYILADGYEQPATLEKYCSLTSSMDGNFKLYMIAAGLLRNAKKVYMTITDSVTGEVIFEKVSENCRKSYYNGAQTGGYVMVDFDASTANLANNRKYDFSMTCELDWEGEQNNTNDSFRFSFYIDDEAPVIKQDQNTLRVKTDKSGNITDYLLDMYIYDNQYIQGYFLYTYDYLDENGNPVNAETVIKGMIPVDDFEGGKVNKITHDLTDLWYRLKDGEEPGSKNIGIQVYDYAKHSTSLYYTLTKTDATRVDFESGRKTTANGDEIVFQMEPYKQKNLFENLDTDPLDVYTAALTWTSSDESVAIVKNGIVTTLKAGTAIITATSATGAKASVTINCRGEAKSDKIPLSGILLNENSVSLERGETLELYAELAPYNITETVELEWNTVSPYVTLTVDPENPLHCTVYAKDSGRANVTVTAKGKLFSATCRVTVKEEFKIDSIYLKSYTGRGDENGVVEIPAEKGITTIYRLAFANNEHITKVIIPEGVEEIQYAAFYGCDNLKEIVLPSTLKKIDEWGIGHNKALETINLESVNTIARLAFYGCTALKAVDLSNCYTICEYAFGFCSAIEELDVSMVGQVDQFAFLQCSGLKTLKTSERPISQYAFAYCTSLQELELDSAIIGRLAFLGCERLSSVTFRSDVTDIGYGAFASCTSLVKLVFEKSVKYIGDHAFSGCSALPSVYIPAGCERLGTYAFGNCTSVESITFSADAIVDETGLSPFAGIRVASFAVEPGSKYLTVNNGVLYTRDMTKLVLFPYARAASSFTVPSTVTEIGDYAFSYVAGLQGTVNLNNVTRVGDYAFSNASSLQAVIGTDHLTEIGDHAFYYCQKLTYFGSTSTYAALPATLTTIGDYAFGADSGIAWGAFTIPAGVKSVGEYAFLGNYRITSAVIPAQMTEIPDGLFAYCSYMTDVKIHDQVTAIGGYAFRKCSQLTSVTLPDSVETMGEAAFAECDLLNEIKLPGALKEIPAYCFYADKALTSLNIPASVTAAGDYAFAGMTGLTALNLNKLQTLGTYALVGSAVTSVTANSLETAGDYAFAGTALTTVTLPALKTVGAYAFAQMTKLDRVQLANVESLGEGAFFKSTAITQLDLPNVRELGDYVFYRAENLQTVTFPKLESIGTNVFYFTKVASVTLPETLTSMASGALISKAYNLENDAVARIETVIVASGCASFFSDEAGAVYRRLENGKYELMAYPSGAKAESYTVLEGTVRIDDQAFATNIYIKEITVARTVTNVGAAAFFGCTALEKLNFLSVEAPTLESRYSQSSADGWTYNNFIEAIPANGADAVKLTVTFPENGVRYDNYLWTRYIGEAQKTGVISMTESTENLIAMIEALPEVVTLENAETVDFINRVLNATSSDQKSFISAELTAKLAAATQTIETLRKNAPVTPDEKPGEEETTGADTTAPDETPTEESRTETDAAEAPSGGCSSGVGTTILPVMLLLAVVALLTAWKKRKGENADA